MRARAVLVLAVWALTGFVVAIAFAAGGPVAFGMRSFTVLSGSMEPVLSTGDVVVDQSVRPGQVRVGDVITFSDPERPERRITHRVRSLRIAGSRAQFVTKGDANDSVERWQMDAGGQLGRVAYRVPVVGYAVMRLNSPAVRLALVALPAVLLAVLELVRVWRPRPRDPEPADARA